MNDIPLLRRFEKGDRVYVTAQAIWVALVCAVMASDRNPKQPFLLTYGDLAAALGMDRKAGITLVRQLGIVGHLCVLYDLPTLNSIVINEKTGQPGDHVVTRPGKTPKQEQMDVMRENWFQIRVPTTGTLRKIWQMN